MLLLGLINIPLKLDVGITNVGLPRRHHGPCSCPMPRSHVPRRLLFLVCFNVGTVTIVFLILVRKHFLEGLFEDFQDKDDGSSMAASFPSFTGLEKSMPSITG